MKPKGGRRQRSRIAQAVVLALVAAAGTGGPSGAQQPAAGTPGPLTDYRALLSKLPAGRRSSILEARDELLRYLTGENRCEGEAACATAVFDVFRTFHERVIRTCDRAFYGNRAAQEMLHSFGGNRLEHPLQSAERDRAAALARLAPAGRPVLRDLFAWRDAGVDFSQGEGDWYLRADPDWMIALASHLPEGEHRQYVVFDANESRERLVEDAGFQVPRDALRQRLVRWDTFIRTHPAVARSHGMRREADRLLALYVIGVDNTPAFDGGVLDEDLRESYARFLAANQDCTYYPLISGLWRKLKANGFRLTEDVLSYLEKQAASNAVLQDWVKALRRR